MPLGGLATAGIIAGGAQALGGVAQTLFSGEKKANRKLEAFAKTIKPSSSILDYYNKALAKYSPNAYTSAAYQQQQNQIGRNLATGITSSQNRRGGLATIGGLVQNANDASARAGAAAEQQQGQNLSRLGQAAQMQTREMQRPEEMQYNLLSAKAGQAASRKNQGLKNIFGGLTTVGGIAAGGMGKSTGFSTSAATGDTSLGLAAMNRSLSKIGKW
jgi:hypothetical protein